MRVFIALEIPEHTKENLTRSAQMFEPLAISGNFVKQQNYHVTLHFLGDVAPSDLIYIQSAMDTIKDCPSLELALLQFTTLKTSDTVCAKLKKNETLTALHEKLGVALEKNNFTVEHRAYRPHITIVRKAKFHLPFAEVTKCVALFNAPFVADKVVLYQSVLSEKGATYTPLYTVQLQDQ